MAAVKRRDSPTARDSPLGAISSLGGTPFCVADMGIEEPSSHAPQLVRNRTDAKSLYRQLSRRRAQRDGVVRKFDLSATMGIGRLYPMKGGTFEDSLSTPPICQPRGRQAFSPYLWCVFGSPRIYPICCERCVPEDDARGQD